jgi:hypothetical protein
VAVLDRFKTDKYEITLWTEITDPDYVVRGSIWLTREERIRRGNRDLPLEIEEVMERLRNIEKYRKFSKAIIEIAELLGGRVDKAGAIF